MNHHIGLVIQVVDVHLGDAPVMLSSCLTKVFQNTDLVIFDFHHETSPWGVVAIDVNEGFEDVLVGDNPH